MEQLKRDAVSTSDAELTARLKTMWAAFNRRDWDTYFAELDPDFAWTPVEENVTYRGRERVLEYMERWLEAWEEFQVELEQLEVAPGGDRGLTIMRYRGKNRASEVPIEGRFFHVGALRNGKPWRAKEYIDGAEARAAFERPEQMPGADNVEIVRRVFLAYAEDGMEATRSFFNPDVEMVRLPGSVQSTARGFDAVVETMRDWMATFEAFHAEPSEFIGAGEHVVVALQEHGTPRGGGVELQQTYFMLYTLRDGKVVRMRWFNDRQDALAAAGLVE